MIHGYRTGESEPCPGGLAQTARRVSRDRDDFSERILCGRARHKPQPDRAKSLSNAAIRRFPRTRRNLCSRALDAMRVHAGPDLGARDPCRQADPPCAGLGGGSADAAAVILAVDQGEGLELAGGCPRPGGAGVRKRRARSCSRAGRCSGAAGGRLLTPLSVGSAGRIRHRKAAGRHLDGLGLQKREFSIDKASLSI